MFIYPKKCHCITIYSQEIKDAFTKMYDEPQTDMPFVLSVEQFYELMQDGFANGFIKRTIENDRIYTETDMIIFRSPTVENIILL